MISHPRVPVRVRLRRVAVLALITAVASALVGGSTVLAVAPPNDTVALPVVFESVRFTAGPVDTVDATATGEPASPCGRVGHSVWYRWRPTSSFMATADTESSDFDTLLAVYRATGSGLTHMACDNNSGPGVTSLLTFFARGGTTYYIQAGGFGADTGSLLVDFTGIPANNRFTKAKVISSLAFAHEVDTTTGATLQSGEPTPSCGPSIGRTIWYRYSPGSNRHLTADTFESEFNTILAVWRGTSIGSLTQIACNDDFAGGSQSQVDWTAKAGRTYYIQVGGSAGEGGDLDFALARIP